MKLTSKGFSIRWKIVLIYFLLVFIAMAIVGVFIMSQLEDYYVNSLRVNLTNIAKEGTLISSLDSYGELKDNQEAIQTNIDAWARSVQAEIFVVDSRFTIVASNTANVGKSAADILDQEIILKALTGEASESQGETFAKENRIPVMNMAFPLGGDRHTGVLYLREDLTSIENTIKQAIVIFVKAMIVGLIVTILLGFFMARSITIPIKEMTEKAAQMVKGDFSQNVPVKSDDEIGQLAEMFNLLRQELNQTLLEMSNEKTKLEIILKHMADGLLAINLAGEVIHANPVALSILKPDHTSPGSNNYDHWISGLKASLTFENIFEKSKEGPVSETFSKAGFSYAIRYTRFQDESGRDIGLIMILQDITERQKLENMQMDFVANVSHELKTPLTTIKSYTETLLSGAMDDPGTTKNFLEIIDSEGDRMNRLVKELLQLSRLDYKKEKWNKKEINVISLIDSALKKLEMTAVQKQQHLNALYLKDQPMPVVVDRDGMEQVILNVLSNAIKYTREGGRIDVDAYKMERLGYITIADNGIGIPESEISRVFERFFRVDKARSRSMGGTGLGLAITKQIVEEHDGTIEIESREGKGTKVTITLPLAHVRGKRGIQ